MLREVEFKLRSASLQSSATSPQSLDDVPKDIMSVTCIEAFREQSSTFATLLCPSPSPSLSSRWNLVGQDSSIHGLSLVYNNLWCEPQHCDHLA